MSEENAIVNVVDHVRPQCTQFEKGNGGLPNKRTKRAALVDSNWSFLLDPITGQLMIDPVLAGDGENYSLDSILEVLDDQEQSRCPVKSPTTQKDVSYKTLKPNTAITYMIERCLENGVIQGELKNNYLTAIEEKERRDEVIHRANNGCVKSMLILGKNYLNGDNGYPTVRRLAFEWFRKAHSADHPLGTAYFGYCKLTGLGTKRELSGVVDLASAANTCMFAAYQLATAYHFGRFDLPMNRPRALHWYKKAYNIYERYELARKMDPEASDWENMWPLMLDEAHDKRASRIQQHIAELHELASGIE